MDWARHIFDRVMPRMVGVVVRPERTRACVLVGIVMALASTVTHAKPAPPCRGCTLDVPRADGPVPLLVVLHGDRERATTSADRWRAAAKQRGWAVLALQCPVALDCKDSFWQWNGDPKWVLDQVAAVE